MSAGVLVAVALVAVALAAFGAGIGPRATGSGGPPPPAAAEPSTQPGRPPGFLEFQDPAVGFAVSYPADWTRVESADPQITLLVAKDSQISFQVRVLDLRMPVGPPELPAAKQVTDQIVMADKSVKILAQQRIDLAGLPGYYYLYTFTDPATGQTGAHSHFFLFKGKAMIAIVFQAIPTDRFRDASKTFDRITGSLRVF